MSGNPISNSPEFPTAALLSSSGTVILPNGLGAHMVDDHGGVTLQELLIPLLVG